MQSYKGDVKIMDSDYANYIQNYDYPKTIEFHQAITSFYLNDFFIQQKLTLAGFDDLFQVNDENETRKQDEPLEIKNESLEKKILMSVGDLIFLSVLSKANICRKAE